MLTPSACQCFTRKSRSKLGRRDAFAICRGDGNTPTPGSPLSSPQLTQVITALRAASPLGRKGVRPGYHRFLPRAHLKLTHVSPLFRILIQYLRWAPGEFEVRFLFAHPGGFTMKRTMRCDVLRKDSRNIWKDEARLWMRDRPNLRWCSNSLFWLYGTKH